MKTIFLTSVFCIFAFCGYSQTAVSVQVQREDGRQATRQRVQAHRVAYFTERMELTPAEAEKFWPLYNTYRNERDRLISETIRLTTVRKEEGQRSEFDISNLSDAEARRLVNNKTRELELERKFHQDLARMFSPQRVLAFYDAERSFQRELMNTTRTRVEVVDTRGDRQRGQSREQER